MMKPIHTTTPRIMSHADERGMTLVEVLIAMTVTLVMTGAALSALVHASRAATTTTSLTEINQNLRIAMNIVIRDLIQAGRDIPVGGVPYPTGTPQPVVRPGPIGFTIEFDTDWVTLPAITPGPDVGPIVNGTTTDIVSILREDQTIDFQNLAVAFAADGSFVNVPAAINIGGATGVKPGDLIMFEASTGNAMQEVTSVEGQRIYFDSSAPSRLNQRGAPAGSVMALQQSGSFPPITISRVLLVTYYIKQESSNVMPYLIRKVNYGGERVIAGGIENLQLTWDLVDGVNNPTNVPEPVDPNTPHQIRKANLHMGARSLDRTSTGMHLRSSLSTQVSLRSLAFVDRYK